MTQYFLHDGNLEQGPFDYEQLKSQKLKRDTKIWHEGLDNWTTVGELEELKDLVSNKTPPPLITPTDEIKSAPPKIEVAKKKSKLLPIIIISVIIIAAIAGWLIYQNVEHGETIDTLVEKVSSQEQTISTQEKVLTHQDEAEQERQRINSAITEKNKNYRNNWSNYIKASHNGYTFSEMGGINNLYAIVNNQTEYMLDEVQVSINYIKTNGDNFKTETVTVYNVPANSSKSVHAPFSNRGTSVNMEIIGIVSKKMHFCYSPGNWANNSEDPYFCK